MTTSIFEFRKVNTLLVCMITTLFVINALSKYSPFLGTSIAIIELLILIILLIRGKLDTYILYLLLFISTSIEVSQFATGDETIRIYNFMYLPIIKSYHILLLTILPIFLVIKEEKILSFIKNLKDFKLVRKVIKGMLLILIVGVFSGSLSLLFNDNGVLYFPEYWVILRREIISFGLIFLWAFFISYLMILRRDFSHKLERLLINIMVSILPSAIITIVFNLHGYYGIIEILLLPLVAFYGILLIIFPFYSDYKNRKILMVVGVSMFAILLIFPTPLSGKWWILSIFIPLFMLWIYFKRLTILKILKLYMGIALVSLVFIAISLFDLNIGYSFSNKLIETKFLQATRTLSFWNEGWFEHLSSSPKFRIDEFINILLEYIYKPQYLLFGKGFGGSIIQHTNFLDWGLPGAFSYSQVQYGIFFSLHETINVLFLKFGLFGLYFFGVITYICLRNFRSNPWIVIGAIWFIFFFNAYISLVLGLCALILGFYYKDIKSLEKC